MTTVEEETKFDRLSLFESIESITSDGNANTLFTNPKKLEKILRALAQPNHPMLQVAVQALQKFLEKPESLMLLVDQIGNSEHSQARQVAAVYLREQIEQFYRKMAPEMKPRLKQFLIEKLIATEIRAERLAIAAAIASVGKFAFAVADEGWNELLLALDKICQPDQNQELKEVGFILWRNLISYCGASLKTLHFGNILKILQRGLHDSDSVVTRIEALKGIGEMTEFLDAQNEVDIVSNVIPEMVAVVDACLKTQDEANVLDGLKVFNALMESKVPVLYPHATALVKFNLKIAAADALPMSVRAMGCKFCQWMCKSNPKIVLQHHFLKAFFALSINLLIEAQERDHQFGKGSGDDRLSAACDMLDDIFLSIPPQHTFAVSVKAVEQLLKDALAKRRQAAYVVLAMMSEGCKEVIAKDNNVRKLLTFCAKGCADDDCVVRRFAFDAIAQLATHLSTQVLDFHQLILERCFAIFHNAEEESMVKERAMTAIEMFVDAAEDAPAAKAGNNNNNGGGGGPFVLSRYLPNIMRAIVNCLDEESVALQEQALSALTSCAAVSKAGQFADYVPTTLQILDKYLAIEGPPSQFVLRASATSCLGALAMAMGRESFKLILPKYNELVMQGLMAMDSRTVRESSFMYLANVAEVMKEGVLKLPAFEDFLEMVLYVMQEDDGLRVELPDDGFGEAVPMQLMDNDNNNGDDAELKLDELSNEQLQQMLVERTNNDGNDDNSEEHSDTEQQIYEDAVGQLKNVRLNVDAGFMEEKAAAIHALSYFVKCCGFEFIPFIDRFFDEVLLYVWEYPNSLVKMSVANCLRHIIALHISYDLKHPSSSATVTASSAEEAHYPWRASAAAASAIEYSAPVQQSIDKIFPLFLQSFMSEEDTDVLTIVLDHFMDILRALGPKCVTPAYMDQLMRTITSFLRGRTSCQESSDMDTVSPKMKSVHYSYMELIGLFAELFEEEPFMELYGALFPRLLEFGRHSLINQTLVIGGVADVCNSLCKRMRVRNNHCQCMSPFADTAFRMALKGAQSTDALMRQNALYCIGALFPVCNQSSNLQHSPAVLRCVSAYMKFDRNGDRSTQLVRDNAVAALGKIIISEPRALPIKELLPAFLDALPLTADFAEQTWVYGALISFIRDEFEIIEPHLQHAMELCALALSDANVNDDDKKKLVDMFQNMGSKQQIQTVVQLLSETAQANVAKCI